MEHSGNQISLNKMANILGMSADTARRYLQMLEDCYLIHLVPRYRKTNEKMLSKKKIYSADLGIRNFLTGFREKGALFENVLYSTIKPWDPSYVYDEGIEIGFITNNKALIEVKYVSTLNENNSYYLINLMKKEK